MLLGLFRDRLSVDAQIPGAQRMYTGYTNKKKAIAELLRRRYGVVRQQARLSAMPVDSTSKQGISNGQSI